MKFIVSSIVLAVLATAACGSIVPLVSYPYGAGPATFIRATPQFNSALVQSEQAGGNFAYSINEGQAFEAVSPLISHEVHPVYSYQWTGGIPSVIAAGPPFVFQHPFIGAPLPAYPTIPFVPPVVAGVEPSSEGGVEPGIVSVSDEADEKPNKETAEDINDDSVSVDSA